MSSATPTRSPRARTIDAAPAPARQGFLRRALGRGGRPSGNEPGARTPSRLGAAVQQVVGAVTAVVQTVVLPAVVVVIVVGAVFVASPPTSGAGWTRTLQVSAAVWLAAQGVPVVASGVTLTLVPLLVTALVVFVAVSVARRVLRPAWPAFTLAVLGYAAVVGVVAAFAPAAAPGAVWRGAVGGALVALVGFGLGVCSAPDAPSLGERAQDAQDALVRRAPWLRAAWLDGVRRGTVAGLVAVLLLVALAGVLLVVWAVSGRSTVGDVLRLLDPGVVGGAVLAVAQLALVPNLVAWAAAWIAGPGFGVGTDSLYSGSVHAEGALPALPIVGVLPGAGWTNDIAAFAPVLVVAIGIVAGGFLWRSHAFAGGTSWSGLAVSVVATVATAGLLVVGLEALANGAAGPGVMRAVGADAWRTGLWVAGEVAIGVVLAASWRLLGVGRWLRRTAERG